MKPITPARRRELDREGERIGTSFDDDGYWSDPKRHEFKRKSWVDSCWYCSRPKAAHEQEKKS